MNENKVSQPFKTLKFPSFSRLQIRSQTKKSTLWRSHS